MTRKSRAKRSPVGAETGRPEPQALPDVVSTPSAELASTVKLLHGHNRELEIRNDALEAEAARLRARVQELETRAVRLKQTITWRLGDTFMRARSVGRVLRLPADLLALVRDARDRRERPAEVDSGGTVVRSAAVARAARERARRLVEQAKALRAVDLETAVSLAETAAELDPKGHRLKWAAGLMYDAGMIEKPAALIERAEALGEPFSPDQAARAEVIRGLRRLQQGGVEVPPRASAPAYEPATRKIVYAAASSLPHHVSGYTTRTHNLIRAVGRRGWSVTAITRPGYPWDRPDAAEVDPEARLYRVDDVDYHRLPGPAANGTAFDRYHADAHAAVSHRLALTRAGLVHAASNYVNALPALAAARQAGVPFVYEVRGLWELTSAARNRAGEASERFELTREIEARVAREADAVLALSGGLRDELIARGVPSERIRLAPNCVDVERFKPVVRDEALAARLGVQGRFVIGFIGSLAAYEGLDDLVEAAAALPAMGVDVALLVVGRGEADARLRERAAATGLSDRLVLSGPVPPEDVPACYGVIDLAAFPRKPAAVTEMVAPLKPLEAMAMGKPVIASDVAAQAELVRDGENGLLFRKGDVAALRAAIARVAGDPALAARLGAAGRDFVERERTWDAAAGVVSEVYEALLGE